MTKKDLKKQLEEIQDWCLDIETYLTSEHETVSDIYKHLESLVITVATLENCLKINLKSLSNLEKRLRIVEEKQKAAEYIFDPKKNVGDN